MRTDLTAEFIAALEAEAATAAICLELELTSTYRYCGGNIPIYLNSNKFSTRGIGLDSLDSESGISMMRAQLSISNTDDAIGAVLLGEESRGKPVNLYWAVLNSVGEIAVSGTAYGQFFKGLLDDFEINYQGDTVTLKCVNELIFWGSKTLLKAEATCPWPFKDATTCRYSGLATYCDQTWALCSTYSNTANYGGDLFLPEISEREYFWGKGMA